MIIPSESVATDMILSKEQLKTIIYKNFLVDETFQKEILDPSVLIWKGPNVKKQLFSTLWGLTDVSNAS